MIQIQFSDIILTSAPLTPTAQTQTQTQSKILILT